MTLTVVGANHRTASIEVRERLHVGETDVPKVLEAILREPGVAESVVLSTCNRCEVYLHARGTDGAVDATYRVLARRSGLARESVAEHVYRLHDREAVAHLFRVVAGLDSMVVGEPQIQGQVGEAYEAARRALPRGVGPVLHRLFQSALSTGGEVRAATGVTEGPASVPAAAVRLTGKVFGELEGLRVLVVGAGEMGEMTLRSFLDRGVAGAWVTSRTLDRARRTSKRTGARPLEYEALWERLSGIDVVVTSTSAPHPVVTRDRLKAVRGPREGPLVVVDIAVPRDVEATVSDLPGVFLYNIDDLQRVVQSTRQNRRREGDAAEALVGTRVADFWGWYRAREAVPLIRGMREEAERIRRAAMEEVLDGMEALSEEDRERIHRASRQALRKILHGPTVGLRELALQDREDGLLEVARRVLDIRGTRLGTGRGGTGSDGETPGDGEAEERKRQK